MFEIVGHAISVIREEISHALIPMDRICVTEQKYMISLTKLYQFLYLVLRNIGQQLVPCPTDIFVADILISHLPHPVTEFFCLDNPYLNLMEQVFGFEFIHIIGYIIQSHLIKGIHASLFIESYEYASQIEYYVPYLLLHIILLTPRHISPIIGTGEVPKIIHIQSSDVNGTVRNILPPNSTIIHCPTTIISSTTSNLLKIDEHSKHQDKERLSDKQDTLEHTVRKYKIALLTRFFVHHFT